MLRAILQEVEEVQQENSVSGKLAVRVAMERLSEEGVAEVPMEVPPLLVRQRHLPQEALAVMGQMALGVERIAEGMLHLLKGQEVVEAARQQEASVPSIRHLILLTELEAAGAGVVRVTVVQVPLMAVAVAVRLQALQQELAVKESS